MPSQVPSQPLTLLARNIKARRTQLGRTQRDVAAELKVEQMTVSRWERGASVPSALNLVGLARVLRCDPAAFYAEGEQEAAA